MATATKATVKSTNTGVTSMDKQKDTIQKPTAITAAILQQLDALSVRRQKWETTDYTKANDGLNVLLAECLDVFQARFINGTDEGRKELRVSLMQRLVADGIRVVKTSTTLTMLARFVFNSDRKRAQGYSYVLSAAVSHEVTAAGFAGWVVAQGGLEEIKRKMVKSEQAKARQLAVETATTSVKGDLELNTLQPLAHVGIKNVSGTYAVLLAKPNVNGGVDIIGSLSDANDALVNALILRMAKKVADKTTSDLALGTQVAKEHGDLLSANIDKNRLVVNG